MIIRYFVQRKIALVSGHHAATFVGEIILIILFSGSDHRIIIQIYLLDMMRRIAFQIVRVRISG